MTGEKLTGEKIVIPTLRLICCRTCTSMVGNLEVHVVLLLSSHFSTHCLGCDVNVDESKEVVPDV